MAPPFALLGLFGSGIMPPEPANRTPEQLAAYYADGNELKILGLIVGFLAIGLVGPLVTAISLQLRRSEGDAPPVASVLQAVAGTVTWVMLTVPLLILIVAAFRPDRSPEMTQALHDLGWILFLIPIAPFMVQNFAIAYGVIRARSPRAAYPRWLAYANVFIALSFIPDLLLPYFTSGAFAYQGVFAFWIPTVTYGAWLNLMAYTTWQAVKREAAPP